MRHDTTTSNTATSSCEKTCDWQCALGRFAAISACEKAFEWQFALGFFAVTRDAAISARGRLANGSVL